MTEVTETAAPAAPNTVHKFTVPGLEGERSLDVATIPVDTRFNLLFGAVAGYIKNRVNATAQRHAKDAAVIAWGAYDAAQTNDPMQTLVPKPEGERPAPADLEASYAAAVKALLEGEIRRQTGETKTRAPKDPVISLVTEQVVREVFNAGKAADPKYTFLKAKADVGADGVAYLNKTIAAKVAAAPEADQPALLAALEKMRDERYVKPAQLMAGVNVAKGAKELPSIL